MSKNIIDKIWEAHEVVPEGEHPAVFAIDFMLIHEVTSAQAFDVLRERGLEPFDRDRLLATLDHSIPTRTNRLQIYDDAARTQVETLRKNCEQFDIPLYDFDKGQGIVHIIGPEYGITQPGMTLVCGDSHTSTHGAFGVLAFGVGTSEVSHVLTTGCILQRKPRTMKVDFVGEFQKGVYAKDAILKLISVIGVGGANGHVIEYTGPAIGKMRMDERMTICNMSIECGARAGLVSPDEETFRYMKGKRFAPTSERWDEAVEYWTSFASDPDASYDREITIDLSVLKPMVTWGTNPGQGIEIDELLPKISMLKPELQDSARKAYDYVELEEGSPILGTPIDWAFLGSCTNARIEDLRMAAEIVRGKKISEGVTFYVVPGSEAVRAQAIAEGLDVVFEEAGASFRMPGCSLCLGMNDDRVPPGKRCISTSNRNFVGRQGTGSRTHLASPATVAMSALMGKITSQEVGE